MIWLIFVLFVLAGWHFLVESIIVPSERAILRLRLFALRDELRRLCLEKRATQEEFEEAQRLLNNTIRLAPTMDAYMLAQWKKALAADKMLSQRIESRVAHFESIASDEVKSLVSKAGSFAAESLCFNSLGWLLYLVPVFIAIATWKSIRLQVNKLTIASEHELSPFQPCSA